MYWSPRIHQISRGDVATHPREREYKGLYRAYCFGEFRLYYQNNLIGETTWRRNKAKSLLKWFLLNPGKPYSTDQLIDLFWNEVSPEKALGNLHVTIHYLRHLLEPSLPSRHKSTFLRRNSNNFYWFHENEHWWTDLNEVNHLYAEARELEKRGEAMKTVALYRRIADFCNGGLMPENTGEEWLQPYKHYYVNMHHQILIKLIRMYQQCNEPDEVLEYAYRALIHDSGCELAINAIATIYRERGHENKIQHDLDVFRGKI